MAGVDRVRERRPAVVSPQRAVVGGAVGRCEAPANPLVGIGLLGRPAEQRADAVAELLDELVLAEARLPGQRLLLRERVHGRVLESLCLHAVADAVLHAALALEDAVGAEAQLLLELDHLRRLALVVAAGGQAQRPRSRRGAEEQNAHPCVEYRVTMGWRPDEPESPGSRESTVGAWAGVRFSWRP